MMRVHVRAALSMIRLEGFVFWWRWFGPTRSARRLKRDVGGLA